MKKKFRKIVVNNKEYEWMYLADYDDGCFNEVLIYEIYLCYNNRNDEIRRRKFFNKIQLGSFNSQLTPRKVRELIEYGHLLSKTEIRKEKLKKINDRI